MTRRLLLALFAAALLCAHHGTARAQAPLYINCITATSTLCNTVSNPGNGTEGDQDWLVGGKFNLDIAALQPPTPRYSVVWANGSGFGGTLPGSSGIWCLEWTSLSAAPTLVSCPGSSSLAWGSITSGTNDQILLIGSGGSLGTSGSGSIAATTAGALAATPVPCGSGQAPTGVAANGNSVGCQAVGGGSGSAAVPLTGGAVKTANYTFAIGDANTQATFNCSSPCTATIPAYTSVAFTLGTGLAVKNSCLSAVNLTLTIVTDTMYTLGTTYSGSLTIYPCGKVIVTKDESLTAWSAGGINFITQARAPPLTAWGDEARGAVA